MTINFASNFEQLRICYIERFRPCFIYGPYVQIHRYLKRQDNGRWIDLLPLLWYTWLPLLKITISGWNVWTLNQPNLIKVPKVMLSQRIRKRYYKTLGTSVINWLMSPSSLHWQIHDIQMLRKKDETQHHKKHIL